VEVDIPADADYFEIRKKSVDIEKLRVFMDGQGYPTDEEITSAITAALEVNEEIDQQFLPTITVKDAVVTVKGEIDTANARKALLKTVWATPGVRDVVDQMKILSKRQLAARQNQQPLLTPPPVS
jgi:osmotically-inducible protein OsmY